MKTHKGIRYGIDFNTKEIPDRIVAVTVELDTWIMTKSDNVNIALCEHPLYPKLHAYCLANPPRRP